MGFFKLKTQAAGPEQRKEIIKRGIFGIVGVILVAYAVSFLGGGANDEAALQNAKSQDNASDTISLDTKSLLEDDAQPSQSAPAPIPAKQKFDYQGQLNTNVGPQDTADAPITAPAPLTTQENTDAVPAFDEDPFASSTNNAQPQMAPQRVEPQPVAQPQTQVAPQPQAVPQVQQAPAQQVAPTAPAKPQATTTSSKAMLYCGSFSSQSKAEEQKALMAFQGIQSTVVKHNGSFMLKLGPYKSRDAARQAFSKVDATGLVSECSLENE